MKTVSLNISERIYALGILNAFKGGLDKLSTILEDIKQFPITDEEWVLADRVIDDKTWRWNDDKGGLKEVNLQKDVINYLIDDIDEKSKKGELTLQDKAAISLRDKLISK